MDISKPFLLVPRLFYCLQVSGWALDGSSIAAISRLEGLTRLRLQGGRGPGTALYAHPLLPLLDQPGLQELALMDVTGLTDDWLAEATAMATGTQGRAPAVRDLHLGAAPGDGISTPFNSTAGSGSGSGSGSISSSAGSCVAMVEAGGAATSIGSRMLTDRGLARMATWPGLRVLHLAQLPGITLAGVKALAAGSSSLVQLYVTRCPAVSAATADGIARAAVPSPGRAIDLWVQ